MLGCAVRGQGLPTHRKAGASPRQRSFLFLLALMSPAPHPSATRCRTWTARPVSVEGPEALGVPWALVVRWLGSHFFSPSHPPAESLFTKHRVKAGIKQLAITDLLWACNSSELHFSLITGKIANWQTSGSGYTPSDLQGRV